MPTTCLPVTLAYRYRNGGTRIEMAAPAPRIGKGGAPYTAAV